MTDMKLQKILTLPDSLSSIEMYLSSGKLVLVGHKYASVSPYSLYRYYTPESRTVVAIYNITSPENPKLERYNQVDGDYRDSRLIGSTLYFLSTSTLRIPPIYLSKNTADTSEFQKVISEVDKNFALKYVVPQIREARSSSSTGKYTQSTRSSVASCSDITFVLPDDETLKHIDFSPGFVVISSIDILTPTSTMKSELLFGDVSQIHMSRSALYITSTISQTVGSSDSSVSDKSMLPWYGQYQSSTLVHRYALVNG